MKYSREFIFLSIHILAVILVTNCEDENYFENIENTEELVDPHSFFYNKQSKTMIKDIKVDMIKVMQNNNEDQNNLKSKQANNYSSHEAIFYKRLINLLLSNIHIQNEDEVSITGILEIEISHSQMEILKNFQIHKTSLKEIDDIFSNIIRKPQYNYISGVMNILDILHRGFRTMLQTIQEHQDGAIIIFTMLIVCSTFRMITWGRRFPIFSIIQVIFILSFFMTWWQLIKEAEVKSIAAQMKFSQIPISCQPDKMNMWNKFVSLFYDDCEKYYETIMTNPKLKITPAFALSHFITTVILHPITHIGSIISVFIDNATGFVIITIPFYLSGASFNLGFGLLKLGIGHEKKKEKGNSLQSIENREPVQIILKVTHGTDVNQITNIPMITQSNALETLKKKEVIATNNDSQEDYDDLCCGDAITNNKLFKNDDKESDKYESLDAIPIERNDGSGDR
ncbi:Chloride channel CLIC protein [Apis cerana cerana]|uniref:Chloride channel CLIC-like protein 1 n=1 Tax=Apis cerana cerana TaxID=94128 RepID=A0A2A3ELP1_APICC|nr:Chloride channel CLIC protein [Apis cerana cerana]